MQPDNLLLRQTLTLQEQLAGLEARADHKRVAWYQAIRRLHSSGMSMREIAEALDLSHQRVHQIVNGGGQMPASMPHRKLVRRLIRRTGTPCAPGGKPGEPGGLPLDRFSMDAREAMARAQEEARGLKHSCIGTEHLLLGLLGAEHGLALRLLTTCGADLERARGSIEALVGRGEETQSPPLPVTPRLKKVLELAREEGKRRHSTHIRSEHILLGLAREGDGLAARLLAELGVNYEQLRRRVDRAAMTCSFCGRSGLDVAHLVAGPNVYICERCTEEASRLAGGDAPRSTDTALTIEDEDRSAACSFCGKQRAEGRRLIAGLGARICTECLALCHEIEEEDRRADHPDRA